MVLPQNFSRIALGTMQFLWTTTEKEAYKILDTYYELGGNIIDTADMYTNWVDGLHGGEAETIIGKWMKQRKNRDKIFLITKVGSRVWEGPDGEGLSEKHVTKAIEKSLHRLQVDCVDLYLSHWSDPTIPIEETFAVYQSLMKQGKVCFIGCSNYSKEELQEALQIGKKLGVQYTFLEAYYNLLDRKTYEEQFMPLVKQYNLQVMPYGPLAGGFLSGVYRKDKVLPTHARAEFIKEKMTEKNLVLIELLEVLAKKYDKTISQVALTWLFSQENVIAPIIGADTVQQIKDNFISNSEWLKGEDVEFLNKITAYTS